MQDRKTFIEWLEALRLRDKIIFVGYSDVPIFISQVELNKPLTKSPLE